MSQVALTAADFVKRLESLKSDAELKKYDRYFPGWREGQDKFMGVRMGEIFKLSKEFIDMPLPEIEKLLENPYHEARTGGAGIMDEQARSKRYNEARKKQLFELYLRRHDRINSWDLVDRSAIYVVGGYLADKPRDPLYKLALSKDMNERRTAMVACFYFIMKQNNTDDALKLAEILLHEKEDLTQKAAGWVLREAGKKDPEKLAEFLDEYASTMPRPMLRNAIERMPKDQKIKFMSAK
jgi:3-methyladenine DNA glycosylase AlkD